MIIVKIVSGNKELMPMIRLGKRWNEPSDILKEMKAPVHEMSDEQHLFCVHL